MPVTFPALPSGNNPYSASASGVASNASGLANSFIAALNQEATRQQQQAAAKQASDVEYAKETERLTSAGYVPAYTMNPPAQASAASADLPPDEDAGKPKRNPAVGNDGQFHTDSKGNDWYLRSKGEQDAAALDDTNSFPLNDELRKDAKTLNIDLPGKKSDGTEERVPMSLLDRLNTASELHKRQHPDQPPETFKFNSTDYKNANGEPTLMLEGDRGTVKPPDLSHLGQAAPPSSPGAAPGGVFDQSAQGGGMFDQTGQNENLPAYAPPQTSAAPSGVRFAPPQKADKPDVSQIVPGYQGPNGGLLTRDTTSNTVSEVPLPAGSKQTMTAAQTEADKDRHVAQDRLAEDRATRVSAADQAKADRATKAQAVVQGKHDDYQSREQDQWQLHQRYADLANPTVNPNGSTVSLPAYNAKTGEISDGQPRTMSDQLRSTMIDQANQAQRKALEQHGYAAGIRKSMGWGEFAKPAQSASQAPQQPAQPTAAPAATARKVGDSVTLKSGKTVRISKINPNGTFEAQ